MLSFIKICAVVQERFCWQADTYRHREMGKKYYRPPPNCNSYKVIKPFGQIPVSVRTSSVYVSRSFTVNIFCCCIWNWINLSPAVRWNQLRRTNQTPPRAQKRSCVCSDMTFLEDVWVSAAWKICCGRVLVWRTSNRVIPSDFQN